MIEKKQFCVNYSTEKKEGYGEDAPPILINKDGWYAVGVFDGMGGAGSAMCDSKFGEGYTKAYVASRIARDIVHEYLEDCSGKNEIITSEKLKQVLFDGIKKEQEVYPPRIKSVLRSRLVREYPTTIALITLCIEGEMMQVDSYWAGDSHCYLWTGDGFFQVSKDDIENDLDPFDNLHNDSPISNCVCTDRDFVIGHNHIERSNEPIIILCATDGCFGYYQTPMHFENILKCSLQKSHDEKEWESILIEEISKVTGDDTSLSLIAIGFSSFEQMKELMVTDISGFSDIIKQEKNIVDAQKTLEDERDKYKKLILDGWSNYKKTYMKYINNEESDA